MSRVQYFNFLHNTTTTNIDKDAACHTPRTIYTTGRKYIGRKHFFQNWNLTHLCTIFSVCSCCVFILNCRWKRWNKVFIIICSQKYRHFYVMSVHLYLSHSLCVCLAHSAKSHTKIFLVQMTKVWRFNIECVVNKTCRRMKFIEVQLCSDAFLLHKHSSFSGTTDT